MKRTVNVMAMAGTGQRFIDAGLTTPKPLISILGKLLFIRASEALPPADLWIFICQQKHLKDSNLKAIIKEKFPSSLILTVPELTRGQAETCLVAEPYLFPDDQVIFCACDSFFEITLDEINLLLKKSDLVILTTNPSSVMLTNPNAYGWVNLNRTNKIKAITCKKLASSNPINDKVIIGSFCFKRADIFLKAVKKLIRSEIRIRNEFYMDSVAEQMLRDGSNINSLNVNDFVSLGTPEEITNWVQKFD